MVKEKAKVVLAYDVHRVIEWFTHNFDKEIGAVGTVEIREDDESGENYFFVDGLHFPKQEVSTSTVDFDSDMWGDIVKDLGMDELGKINFYWHKHPGSSPSCSGTDEKETFDTFMSKEGDRNYFIFLQTAGSNGDTNFEARIDLRRPVRATVLHDSIDIAYELSEEDQALRDYCENILDECVTEKKYYTKRRKKGTNKINYSSYSHEGWNKFEERDEGLYADNNIVDGLQTSIEEKASIHIVDGKVKLLGGELFQKTIDSAVDKSGKLYPYFRQEKKRRLNSNGEPSSDGSYVEYELQPASGKYDELVEASKAIYRAYNKKLKEVLNDKIREQNDGFNRSSQKKLVGSEDNYPTVQTVNDEATMNRILEGLGQDLIFDWSTSGNKDSDDSRAAIIYSPNKQEPLGSVYLWDENGGTFYGKEVVQEVINIQGEIWKESQDNDVILAEQEEEEE